MMRLRSSGCQSQIPTDAMLPFDWLIHSGIILARYHKILASDEFNLLSVLANQRARKVLFTCVEYNNKKYSDL